MPNYTLKQGDGKTFSIPLRWDNKPFIPDVAGNIIFTAKKDPESADAAAGNIQKTIGVGITVNGTNAEVELVYIDTNTLDPGPLYYDLQYQFEDESPKTIADGIIELRRGITRETTTSVTIYTTAPPYPSTATDITNAPTLSPITGTEEVASLDGTTLKKNTWTQIKDFFMTFLGTAATKDTGTTEGTVPLLGAGGKFDAARLPTASNTVLGGIKSSASVSVDAGGVATVSTDYAPSSGISPSAITGTAVITNDARLSNARTPTAHPHVSVDISDASTSGSASKLIKYDTNGKISGQSFAGSITFDVGAGIVQQRSGFTSGLFTVPLTDNRVLATPDKDGTFALTSDITGTNSGTNTGDETSARIATIIAGQSAKTTIVDADELPILNSGASYDGWKVSFTSIWTWIKSKIDADKQASLLTPAGALEIPAPGNGTYRGQTAKYHVVPSAECILTLAAGIVIPSDSAFVSRTIPAGKTCIVQLEWLGSFWSLTTIVGNFTVPV